MSKKTMKFKTEVSQLLDLVVNSLYSNKEIFLRELISNSSDAIDKIKYEGLKNKDLLEGNEDYKMKIDFNEDANTITITDNGIGMTKDEVITNIGTIAKSGTKEFMEKLKAAKESTDQEGLIGQFGVGFYSAFIVSDKIVLITKKAGKDTTAVKWESNGKEKFSIDDIADKTDRGTEIVMYLKEDDKEFASEWKIKEIVKKYSDYISYPIAMDIKREEKPKDKEGKEIEDAESITTIEEEILNSQKAIWKKDKKDIKDEEYNDFYKHISHDYTDALDRVHISVEGAMEYKALLYIPAKAPHDLFMRENKSGVNLYVKNVFIKGDFKNLLPEYLRFITGVVDSSDLPLNVSREILQEDKMLEKIQKNLVKKVLDLLKKMKEKKYEEKYLDFYKEFGKLIKEGVYTDFTNKDKLLDLLLYESTNTEKGKYTSLKEYVKNMPEDQKEIFFIAGDSREALENSPHLERFKEKKYEVLFFTDSIDEWVTNNFNEYDGKKVKSIGKGEVELGETEDEKKSKEETKKEFTSLVDLLKDKLKDDVKDVKISSRLTSSAVCLVSDDADMSANMEKILKQMNQDVPESKRILEVNPKHPILDVMKNLFEADKEDSKISEYAELLFDQALISEGSPVKNPAIFASRMSDLMVFEGKATK